jgi:hypothetical protein
MVSGVYSLVVAKHSKHFSLHDNLATDVDRIGWNFCPLAHLWFAIIMYASGNNKLQSGLFPAIR